MFLDWYAAATSPARARRRICVGSPPGRRSAITDVLLRSRARAAIGLAVVTAAAAAPRCRSRPA